MYSYGLFVVLTQIKLNKKIACQQTLVRPLQFFFFFCGLRDEQAQLGGALPLERLSSPLPTVNIDLPLFCLVLPSPPNKPLQSVGSLKAKRI